MHAVNLRRLVFIWLAVFWMAFLGIVCTSYAGDVNFGWDAYTDTATGFKLYCGRTANVAVSPDNLQATIVGTNVVAYTKTAMATGTWYCAMTAYDANTESVKSNEISFLVTLKPPAGLNAAQLLSVIKKIQGAGK